MSRLEVLSRLLLVRHGETKLNSSERHWGHTDVKLSPVGIHQAESLRDHLAGEQINFAYSSDLRWALLTAKTIASGLGLKVTACPELREIDFGKIEGLTIYSSHPALPGGHPYVGRAKL